MKISKETKYLCLNTRNNVFQSWSIIFPKYSAKELLIDQKLQIHIIYLYIYNICSTNIKLVDIQRVIITYITIWQNLFASFSMNENNLHYSQFSTNYRVLKLLKMTKSINSYRIRLLQPGCLYNAQHSIERTLSNYFSI